MKMIPGKWLTTLIFIAVICVNSAHGSEADIEKLKMQVQQLIEQNQKLTARLIAMETSIEKEQPPPSQDEEAETTEELFPSPNKEENEVKINEYVSFSGAIESEIIISEDFEGGNSSEINLSGVDLGFDIEVSEWINGYILASYDGGGNEDIYIDEAFIQFSNNEKLPFTITVGKLYMPFGKFETNMIQDPLTLEIGEISDYGLTLGFEARGFYGATFVYNGMNETGDDQEISSFGVTAGYSYSNDTTSLEAGISWVNNIADAGTITDHLNSKDLDTVESRISGLSTNLLATVGSFSLIGEYTVTLDTFSATEIAFDTSGAEPKAWNIEIGYATELLGKETVFALGYQGSEECIELELPERRIIGAASFVIFNGTTVSFEYLYDEDYSRSEGGTGDGAGTFTTNLSYEF